MPEPETLATSMRSRASDASLPCLDGAIRERLARGLAREALLRGREVEGAPFFTYRAGIGPLRGEPPMSNLGRWPEPAEWVDFDPEHQPTPPRAVVVEWHAEQLLRPRPAEHPLAVTARRTSPAQADPR